MCNPLLREDEDVEQTPNLEAVYTKPHHCMGTSFDLQSIHHLLFNTYNTYDSIYRDWNSGDCPPGEGLVLFWKDSHLLNTLMTTQLLARETNAPISAVTCGCYLSSASIFKG